MANKKNQSFKTLSRKDRIMSISLKMLVFISGAVLMGFEIIGSRVIAPYFGSSIFTWGSLIGIFLGALSLGYYLGGKLSDRYPNIRLLTIILSTAGVMILLVPLISDTICNTFMMSGLGSRWEPLFASFTLFFLPSILMGMTSPFAVKLSVTQLSSLGNEAGILYALSTLGSIAGTLFTAFIFIPEFQVTTVINILGILLIIPSFIFVFSKRKLVASTLYYVLILFVTLMFIVSGESLSAKSFYKGKIIYNYDSEYHNIKVIDRNNVRSLCFDKYIESSIYINNPDRTASPYTEAFHLPFIFNREIKNVLFIGGGGGIGPKKFLKDYPDAVVDMVEIDPYIIDVAVKFFDLPEKHDRLETHAIDGRQFIKHSRKKWDLVVLDAFTIGGKIPFHLMTREFLSEICDSLTEKGIVMINLNASLSGKHSQIFLSAGKTFYNVYGNLYVFPIYGQQYLKQPQNIILLSEKTHTDLSRQQIIENARYLEATEFVKVANYTKYAERYYDGFMVDKIKEGKEGTLLTDNYAPVENMVAE